MSEKCYKFRTQKSVAQSRSIRTLRALNHRSISLSRLWQNDAFQNLANKQMNLRSRQFLTNDLVVKAKSKQSS